MLDTTTLCACVAAVVSYNIIAIATQSASGLSMMLSTGRVWATKHVELRGAPDVTLAIQTLRNTVLVATFVGTLSFTVAVASLNAAASDDASRLRAVIAAVFLIASFLNFALVIRCAAHVGYLIGSATSTPTAPAAAATTQAAAAAPHVDAADTDTAVPRELGALVRMQAVHFSLGFRSMYCAIPFAFAIAGREALIASTVVMIAFLVYIDHAIAIWAWCGARAATHRRLV